jgi:hypothetical protein
LYIKLTIVADATMGDFMFMHSLFALAVGVGLQAQAQPAAPPPVNVTQVIAMLTVKPGITRPDVMKVMPEEIRETAVLYLEGKIEQWYSRGDGRGVVFFLRCKTVEEGKEIMEGLPLHKAGYVDVDYVPVGPLTPLRLLLGPQGHTDGTGTR